MGQGMLNNYQIIDDCKSYSMGVAGRRRADMRLHNVVIIYLCIGAYCMFV